MPSNFNTESSKGLAEPPEGVISGEDVPVENQLDEFDEKSIQECIGIMKTRGEPYTSMADSELREKSREILDI